MAGNTFGQLFRVTTFGESHGAGIGAVIDGCPAGLAICAEEIQAELDRRRPGQSTLMSARREPDKAEILSGVFEGKTLGTPIALLVRNQDVNSELYGVIKDIYRPGHADFTYDAKFGLRDYRGGGRASARETAARVAAGAVAKKLLNTVGIKIAGYVMQVGNCQADKSAEFEDIIAAAKAGGDSVGGVVEIVARGVPAGLGEPVFHKLSADLAAAMMSIPAAKGFEIGNGFKAAELRGSENNDALIKKDNGKIGTATNRAGGIVGGISNGEDIVVRVAFKPASSIAKAQATVNKAGQSASIKVTGRHDPCVCPRAVPVVEAMMALALADHLLLNKISRL